MPADDSEVRTALRGVQDPELEASIVDLGLVAGIARDGGTVVVHLALPLSEEHWPPEELVRRVEATVGALPGVETVVVERRPMSDEEVAATARVLRGEPPANPLAPDHVFSFMDTNLLDITATQPIFMVSGCRNAA